VSSRSRRHRRAYDRAVQFSFAGTSRNLPMTLRVCRSLVWTQAAFVILAGIFVVFASTVFGSSNSIPFHGDTLSGGRAAMLGGVYIVAGLALIYLAVELGRLASWARNAIVSVQVFLAVLLFFRSFEISVSVAINVFFYAAVIALLFAPETRRALEGTRASSPATAAEAPVRGPDTEVQTLPGI
jgi:hypothetical protein